MAICVVCCRECDVSQITMEGVCPSCVVGLRAEGIDPRSPPWGYYSENMRPEGTARQPGNAVLSGASSSEAETQDGSDGRAANDGTLVVTVDEVVDRLGRRAIRIDAASDKYTCDTCDRRLCDGEGYLLTTQQVVTSVEAWRRVIDKWKPRCIALSRERAFDIPYLVATKTRAKCESIAESVGRMTAALRLECPDETAAILLEHSLFWRGSSETPWVICDGCADMFTFHREQARLALDHYRRSGEFPKGGAVLSISEPNDGGRVLLESKDDNALDAMLRTINAALQPSFDVRVRPAVDSVDTVDDVRETAETWLHYYLAGLKREQNKEKEWAVHALYDLSLKQPTRAWEAVQHINSHTIRQDQTRRIVDVSVGGSLLANVLYVCDDVLCKTIFDTAAGSKRLRRQLGSIHKSSISQERCNQLRGLLTQMGEDRSQIIFRN